MTFMYVTCLVGVTLLAVIPSPEARKNLMKLAQRMIRTFSLNMSTSSGQSWTALSDSPEDTVRITTRKITNPGQPNGVILSAASTTWLPYSHSKVFDLLKDERRRSQVRPSSHFISQQIINSKKCLTIYIVSSWIFSPMGTLCMKWLILLTAHIQEIASLFCA